jgi:hypothetical protein
MHVNFISTFDNIYKRMAYSLLHACMTKWVMVIPRSTHAFAVEKARIIILRIARIKWDWTAPKGWCIYYYLTIYLHMWKFLELCVVAISPERKINIIGGRSKLVAWMGCWGKTNDRWSPGQPSPAGPPPAPGAGDRCITTLAPMLSCVRLLEGRNAWTPTSKSGGLLNSGVDEILQGWLCPVILDRVNKSLPRLIDLAPLAFIPVACNLGLPPQILYVCHSKFYIVFPLLFY